MCKPPGMSLTAPGLVRACPGDLPALTRRACSPHGQHHSGRERGRGAQGRPLWRPHDGPAVLGFTLGHPAPASLTPRETPGKILISGKVWGLIRVGQSPSKCVGALRELRKAGRLDTLAMPVPGARQPRLCAHCGDQG